MTTANPKDNHQPECTCNLDMVPHADRCANCDCGLAGRRERDVERKRKVRTFHRTKLGRLAAFTRKVIMMRACICNKPDHRCATNQMLDDLKELVQSK